MTVIAVLGLGEAGAIYARGLRDAGYEVAGYDPFTTLSEPGIRQEAELADALNGAELVISLVGAKVAALVAGDALPLTPAGAVYADMNTASPALKAELETAAAEHDVLFTDIAVLAPVPRDGVRTPLMASGRGSTQFLELFHATGAPVESIGGAAGDAASRKLLRSVFMKGLAALLIESIGAAERAGAEKWMREQVIAEFSGDAAPLIDRLISGSKTHAERRAHEVEDAKDYLESLGQPTWVIAATREWFGELLREKALEQTNEGISA